MINECIKQLVTYGVSRGLIEIEDMTYTINMLLAKLALDSYEDPGEVKEIETPGDLETVLGELLNYAVEKQLINEDSVVLRDLFDTGIMNVLVPKPSQVIRCFWEKYEESPRAATDYFYALSKNSDYIRTYRVARDQKWVCDTPYGELDITINLSKPEKDPKMIALAKTMPGPSYPKCQLCVENEGYAGRINHPARQNHRIIPIQINHSQWGFQYSPYVYYNEHCIVFNGQHVPMQINRATFEKMLDFIDMFPHYFVGSNADLPIVGGSILSHDHFQGGHYTFAMERAQVEIPLTFTGYEDMEAGIVKWPLSVIRLRGKDRQRLTNLAEKILIAWRGYSNRDAFIFANTEGEDHNTITPIARMRDGSYELDLVLRNNITTKEHPLGLYHPWEEYHNIKKENIGLIEVMGLAVLPARLNEELEGLAGALAEGKDFSSDEMLKKHVQWVESFRDKYESIDESNVHEILRKEVGTTFLHVLECAGVYKCTKEGREYFLQFVEYVNE